MIKAALLDFDGTLVDHDMTELLAELSGKDDEVKKNNQNFHSGLTTGLKGLVNSINLLKGISVTQIDEQLISNDYLMLGAKELIGFFKEEGIVTILASGSIEPVLEHYKRLLNIDYIIGSRPQIERGIVQGISENDYSHSDFKLFETKKILKKLSIKAGETVAIGDSAGDKSRFMFAGTSIAINPKGDISEFSDHVISGDLRHAIPIISKILVTDHPS